MVNKEREISQQNKHDAPASMRATELTCDSAYDKARLKRIDVPLVGHVRVK